ncbi:hypothetical protein JOD67_002103 [Tenggerimyces flavus]|nr:hypothetical protein [Tenggerimyces flavus]
MKVPFIQNAGGVAVVVVAGGAGVMKSGWVGGTLVRTSGTGVPPTQTGPRNASNAGWLGDIRPPSSDGLALEEAACPVGAMSHLLRE